MTGLIFIAVMFLLLWLLLIQPQRRRQRELVAMQAAVKEGDEVLTTAGLYGHVRGIGEENELSVEIAPGTTVRMDRRAVAAVVGPVAEPEALEPASGEAEEPDRG